MCENVLKLIVWFGNSTTTAAAAAAFVGARV